MLGGQVLCVDEDCSQGQQGGLSIPGSGVGRVVDHEIALLAVGCADGRREESELNPGVVQVVGDQGGAGAGFGY